MSDMAEWQAATFTVGSKLRFDGKRTSWLVRAQTKDKRYSLATCAEFGKVYYTIIDHEQCVRGPMNISGGGLDIFTTNGPDARIDEAIAMLEEVDGDWEVSSRHGVPLNITFIKNPADASTEPANRQVTA